MAAASSSTRAATDPSFDLLADFALTPENTRQITYILRGSEKTSQYIQLGIQLASDAACDAEELTLEDKVTDLEKDVRNCIDLESQFQHQQETLKNISHRILNGERIRNMIERYTTRTEELAAQYNQTPEHTKYKQHEAYVDFKQRVWDINHKDTEMPSSRDEQADDDIVVGRTSVSLRCPLTTVLLENPVTSKLCKHSFSEHALMQLLRQNGQPMVCPISGCSQLISQDILFKNHVLAQKVERVKKQEAQKNSSSSDYHEVVD